MYQRGRNYNFQKEESCGKLARQIKDSENLQHSQGFISGTVIFKIKGGAVGMVIFRYFILVISA